MECSGCTHVRSTSHLCSAKLEDTDNLPGGGLRQSDNRTNWPVHGGAVAFQPGWFQGHSQALLYVNIGINGPGEVAPPNMSHNVVKDLQIIGPTNLAYPDQSICLPQVPMPPDITFNVGDNITIQIVEAAQHGAALFSVSWVCGALREFS